MATESISRRSLLAGGACVAAAAAVASSVSPSVARADDAPDFQAIYDALEDDDQKECCTVYEDGSGILVDDNPKNSDGGDFTYTLAGMNVREAIFEQLGLPQILEGMFGQCSASDGWQSRIRNGYEVTWKYYPDAGLRVFIEWLGKE